MGRDFIGWNSAYDGKPLDKAEMEEWLDETVASVLNSDGGETINVLELGTGSGMILFNLAPSVQSYIGLEISCKAVDFVVATAKSNPAISEKVNVYQGAATDLHLAKGSEATNVVVINSVTQCFPSRAYLRKVIQGILQLENVRTIFFGDVRSFALEKEFLVSKVLENYGDDATKIQLREELKKSQAELLVDPAFFTGLPILFPNRINHVEIRPKMIHATNELSKYRYSAVIHVRSFEENTLEAASPQKRYEIHDFGIDTWIDFAQQQLDKKTLLLELKTTTAEFLAVQNITYSKTVLERHIIDSLGNDSPQLSWLSAVRHCSERCPSLSPLDLDSIAQEAGFRVSISWARQRSQRGAMDAIFYRADLFGGRKVLFQFPVDHNWLDIDLWCNKPLQ